MEYGHLTVTYVGTMPESDWEMTTLQVTEKNRVRMSVLLSCVKECVHIIPLLIHSTQSSGNPLDVTLFHFLSWPREGSPPVDSMLKMMGEVEYKQQDGKGPLMVMCE